MTKLDERLERALQCAEKKDYGAAIRLCSAVIYDNPEKPTGYRKRAHVYARMEKWEDAVQDIDRAINLGSQEPADFFTRGRVYLRMNEARRAYEDLTKVIELGSYYGDHYYTEMAFFFRAECLLRLGQFKEALADCERVREDVQTFIYPSVKSKADIVREAMSEQPSIRSY